MKVHGAGPDAARVAAASLGEPAAVEEVVAAGLPVVRAVVRGVLGRHPDADDVVQEAMVRAVRGLPGLREPERFRSWLVTVALREARTWARAHRVHDPVDVLPDLADPTDVADLAVTRAVLAGERRDLAAAARWLDAEDRRSAALWWQETTGALTRAEVVETAGTSAHATAVRVHRMRARLEDARRLVRALGADPRCPGLDEVARRWDGRPASVWRKRFNRHITSCRRCGGDGTALTSVEVLVLGLAVAPPSALLTAHVVARLTAAVPAAAAAVPSVLPGVRPAGTDGPSGFLRALARVGSTKPALVAATVTVAAAVVTPVVLGQRAPRTVTVEATDPAPSDVPTVPARPATSPARSAEGPTTGPIAVLPASPPATRVASPTATARPASRATAAGPRYGSVVDTADAAPPADRRPGPLPRRPLGPAVRAVGGDWAAGRPGWIGGDFVMMNNSQSVVLRGRGYVRVRYETAFFNPGRTGEMVMPTWVGLKGRLFHVASGGWRRKTDLADPADPSKGTWLGNDTQGWISLPKGAQTMWENEFFYLDGEVTLHNNEGVADYNISATPMTWQQVVDDITAPRPQGTQDRGWRRYGLVRDTGDDGTPVPQYLTRATPAEAWQVPQRSKVS